MAPARAPHCTRHLQGAAATCRSLPAPEPRGFALCLFCSSSCPPHPAPPASTPRAFLWVWEIQVGVIGAASPGRLHGYRACAAQGLASRMGSECRVCQGSEGLGGHSQDSDIRNAPWDSLGTTKAARSGFPRLQRRGEMPLAGPLPIGDTAVRRVSQRTLPRPNSQGCALCHCQAVNVGSVQIGWPCLVISRLGPRQELRDCLLMRAWARGRTLSPDALSEGARAGQGLLSALPRVCPGPRGLGM